MSTCDRLAVTTLVILVTVPTSRVWADVYRCVQDGGHIMYQQIPCSFDSRPMRLNDRPSGWSPLRPGEKDLLSTYRDRDAGRRRKPQVQARQSTAETKDCWRKRKQLEAVRSQLRRGYTLKEGEQLHRKRDDHEEYLRQFCS